MGGKGRGAHGMVTGMEENITETDEAKADRQTDKTKNTKLKCTVKQKRPPGNCNGPTGMPDNDAAGC